jgi:hypothetical protein
MSRKRHRPEEIVAKLRQVEVLTAQGPDGRGGDPLDRRDRGELRDELLNGEIFYTLQEAKVVIEGWRRTTTPFAHTHPSATSRPHPRFSSGRLRFPGQLRRPPRPWRSNLSCTNIRPGPPHGGRPSLLAN